MDDRPPPAFRSLMWGLPSPEELEKAAHVLETLFEPVDEDGELSTPDELREFGLNDYRDYVRLLRFIASDLRRSERRVENAGYEWDFEKQDLLRPKDGRKGRRGSYWVLLTGEAWLRTRTSKRNDKEAREAVRQDLLGRGFPPQQCTDEILKSRIQAFQRLGHDV